MTFRTMIFLSLLFIMTSAEESDNVGSKGTKQKRITNINKEEEYSRKQTVGRSSDEKSTTSDDDEDKKTLAQQVIDGKYGLIQTELFSSPIKRPGIISYEVNPEVPKDNINNFGGLQPDEIWLAENHLLVLKGGTFNEKSQESKVGWPPIDNYIAPQRQVKIPPNPKIPPPFPIQLKDGGPIEFIEGKNETGGFPPFLDPFYGPPFFPPSFIGPPYDEKNDTLMKQGNSTQGNGKTPFPFLPPRIGPYPPGVAYLPPPENLTELDEDDPSLYYPPKYDFVYPNQKDISHVPPGPLVPGIILPPPPDFFGPLENKSKTERPTENTKINNFFIKKPNKTRTQTTHFLNTKTKEISRTQKQKPHTTLTILDKVKNEVQIKSVEPNVTFEEWIPIPAPRPFYITDIKNIGTNENEKYSFKQNPKNGWIYQDVSPLIKNSEDKKKTEESQENVTKKGRFYLPPDPNEKTKPEDGYARNKPVVNFRDGKVVSNDNYKIFDFPKDETSLTTAGPQYTDFKTNFFTSTTRSEVNTIPTQMIYEEVTAKTPVLGENVLIPRGRYHGNAIKTILTTKRPLSYFYFPQAPKYQADDGFTYNLPINAALNFKSQPSNFELNAQEKAKFPNFSTTKKPPVYEYSYSAPGYGSLEPPKIGVKEYATTPKTIKYETNYRTVNPDYTYYDYQSQNQDNNYKNWNSEQYYTTETSHYNKPGFLDIKSYPKSNSEVRLLDSITKKYFTTFGQKLNQEIETTTPLPNNNQQRRPIYERYPATTSTTKQENRQEIKYPDLYNTLNDGYYTKQNTYNPVIYNKTPKSNIQSTDNYSYYYPQSERESRYQRFRGYEADALRPGHSLDSDITVNYKLPSPPIEPEAEFLHPAYINPLNYRGSSYISYSLPGNGGHFYFLTPQSIPAETYIDKKPQRIRYPEVEKGGYIIRNARHKKK